MNLERVVGIAQPLERWMPQLPIVRPSPILDLGNQRRSCQHQVLSWHTYRRERRLQLVELLLQRSGDIVPEPGPETAEVL